MRTYTSTPLTLVSAAALALALLFVGSGCDQADETALAGPTSPEAEMTALPAGFTLQDLPADLALTADQSSAIQSAIARMNSARTARWAEHRAKRDRDRLDVSSAAEPPFFAFLEDASRILSTDQFVKLTQFLSERRTERVSEFARRGIGPEGRRGAREHMDRFGRQLGLSPAEGRELRSKLREMGQQLRDLAREVEAGAITPEAARDRAKQIREDMRASAGEVLSPEQIAKFEQRRNARRAEIAERRLADLPARLDRRAEFLGRVLSLDATQLSGVRAAFNESIEARRANLEQAKSGAVAPEEAMYQAWVTERATADKVRSLLSTEQAVKFDALTKLLPPALRFAGRGSLGR